MTLTNVLVIGFGVPAVGIFMAVCWDYIKKSRDDDRARKSGL
jgi:hypothetical protein